jgi:hypothetical protein
VGTEIGGQRLGRRTIERQSIRLRNRETEGKNKKEEENREYEGELKRYI